MQWKQQQKASGSHMYNNSKNGLLQSMVGSSLWTAALCWTHYWHMWKDKKIQACLSSECLMGITACNNNHTCFIYTHVHAVQSKQSPYTQLWYTSWYIHLECFLNHDTTDLTASTRLPLSSLLKLVIKKFSTKIKRK